MEEKDFIKALKKGSEDAFSRLVAENEKKVFHIAYAMLSDYDEALDASQEVFIKVYCNIKKFKGESSLSTWIYRIAKNVCLDILKKKKVVTLSLDEKNDDGVGIEIEDDQKGPEDTLIAKETSKIVWEAISKLNPEQRLIIIMRDIKGLSYEEISKDFSLPLGTVKSRIKRAREALKKILENKRELF